MIEIEVVNDDDAHENSRNIHENSRNIHENSRNIHENSRKSITIVEIFNIFSYAYSIR